MIETDISQQGSRSTTMSLPKHLYTDEQVYQRDVKWLRENMWLMAGHESLIPRAGDFFLYEFDTDSVIVIRDHAGQVKAHHNVCRHRGSRICFKSQGSVRALTCPYHAWSYELNGSLRAAPFASREFDKTEYALIGCHVRLHCGLIFLSFARIPPAFEDYIAKFTREFELQDVQRSKIAKQELFAANANWKLLVENNLECYHCRVAHPTYCAAHPGNPLGRPAEHTFEASYERVRSALPLSESEMKREFTPVYTGNDSAHFQILLRGLIGEGCSTESSGGKPVAPLMGPCTYEGVQTVALPSPLVNVVLNPDYVAIYTFTPRSVRRTDMQVIWLVKETAVEGVDYDVNQVTAVWDPTLQEDKILAENTQLGVESTACLPGPFMETERFVADFDLWYMRRVANETPGVGA